MRPPRIVTDPDSSENRTADSSCGVMPPTPGARMPPCPTRGSAAVDSSPPCPLTSRGCWRPRDTARACESRCTCRSGTVDVGTGARDRDDTDATVASYAACLADVPLGGPGIPEACDAGGVAGGVVLAGTRDVVAGVEVGRDDLEDDASPGWWCPEDWELVELLVGPL